MPPGALRKCKLPLIVEACIVAPTDYIAIESSTANSVSPKAFVLDDALVAHRSTTRANPQANTRPNAGEEASAPKPLSPSSADGTNTHQEISVETVRSKPIYDFVKRTFDVVSCTAALAVLAVPMAAVAVAIKRDSPGPIFYTQERLGKGGKPFKVIKFRSMVDHAEAVGGAQWASENDPRVTRVGRYIRDTRIDELPQFINVIRGDMSLIGPRPERPVFYEEFERDVPGFHQRLAVKPGVSGLAQVNGGYGLTPAQKLAYDLEYIEHRGPLLDAVIIAKTIKVLFTHEGAW